MPRRQPAQPVMPDPDRFQCVAPSRGVIASVSAFSRIAFGFKFMFSPVSAKTDVNESQTAIGTLFFISARTQWKSPMSRQRVSKKMPRS